MNTQARVHRLQAGQSLLLSPGSAGAAILAEGDVLLQAPAQWLAGMVTLPAPVRLVAPAMVPSLRACTIVAVRDSAVVVPEPVAPWSVRRSFAAARAILSKQWMISIRSRCLHRSWRCSPPMQVD